MESVPIVAGAAEGTLSTLHPPPPTPHAVQCNGPVISVIATSAAGEA